MIHSIRHSSRRDRRIPLLLVYLGANHPMDLSHHPNGPGFHLLYYCAAGRGECVLEGRQMLLQQGQLLLVRRDTTFSCRALREGCTVHLLGFTGACCDALLDSVGLEQPGIYQVSEEGLFPDAVERLLDLQEQESGQEVYSPECYRLLVALSSRMNRLSEAPAQLQTNEAVQMVIDYLETHYQEPLSLDTLAKKVHLTKEYLCVVFKRETGRTILQHLTLIRIGWARLYLEQYPDKKACEIGRMCGFESPSYFGKKFREVVGMTPEGYRRVNSVVV